MHFVCNNYLFKQLLTRFENSGKLKLVVNCIKVFKYRVLRLFFKGCKDQ